MGRDNEGFYWIPIHMRIGLDEDRIVFLSVPVVYLEVLIRRYQFFLAVIEESNMMDRGVSKYGL